MKKIDEKTKKKIESAINLLGFDLFELGYEMDHHWEFCSAIIDISTKEVVATVHDNGEVDFKE